MELLYYTTQALKKYRAFQTSLIHSTHPPTSPLPLRKHELQPPRRRRKLIPHIPQHGLAPPRPRRERHIESAQQARRHGPDLHEGEVLPNAAEAAAEEGREGGAVVHELGRRGPALGQELEGPREAGFEAVQGVDGAAEDGGAGDEGGGDGEAFGGGLAKARGRDGWMEAEGFVDGAVEVGERLEGAGGGVGGEFGADFGGVGGVEGEVVEEQDEGGGGGVGAGDDDAEGVAVEPAAVRFEGVVFARRGYEPGGDVVVVGAVVVVVVVGLGSVDAFAHLGVGPDEHGLPAGGHAGDAEANAGEPGRGREDAEQRHAVAHQVDGEVGFAGGEHVEGFAEGELTHEVEGEVVEPGCDVHGRAQALGYGRCEE